MVTTTPCTTLLSTVCAVTSAAVFDQYLFDAVGSSSVDFVQIQFRVLVDGTEVTSPDSPITFNETLHIQARSLTVFILLPYYIVRIISR